MASRPQPTKNQPARAAAAPAKNQPAQKEQVGRAGAQALGQSTKPPQGEQRRSVPAVVRDQLPVDPDMLAAMQEDAGAGVSTAASDNIVPLIYVLQAQSPQVLRQKAEYIDGARDGMFWMRGTKEVVDGDVGLPVVLCHMNVSWIEWRPNRGGYVGRHDEMPQDAKWVEDPQNPKRGNWTRTNGNIVVETREHAVIRIDTGDGYVIAMSGSNHGTARQWMTNCNRKRIPNTTAKAPLWGYVWRLKTVPKTNDDGDWYGISVEEELDDAGNHQLTWLVDNGSTYALAKQTNADFEAGAKTSEQLDDGAQVGGNASDDGGSGDDDKHI